MDSQKPKNLLTKLPAIEDLEIDYENHKDDDVETQPAGLTFKCSKCSMVFDQYIVYKLHLKAAKPLNESKKCEDCSFTSCTKAGLKAHVDSEHKINFRCTFCKASFDENEKLIQHLKEHKIHFTQDLLLAFLRTKKLDAVLYLNQT